MVFASLSNSHCSSRLYVPPPMPMKLDDTAPEMPMRQLSVPPPMKVGAMALGGGVDPGALPLYVVLELCVELFELLLFWMLLPC